MSAQTVAFLRLERLAIWKPKLATEVLVPVRAKETYVQVFAEIELPRERDAIGLARFALLL